MRARQPHPGLRPTGRGSEAGFGLATAALAAIVGVAAPAAALDLFFTSPPAGQPVWGLVTIELEVVGEAPAAIRLSVDGREVGVLERPPWRLEVDLGDAFGPHRFEAHAESPDGPIVAVRETPALAVDDALEVGLQQLYVTVERRPGDRGPLGAGDFEVWDDGRRQRIVTFAGGDAALTVALLIDASRSMRGRPIAAALEGVRAFAEGMRELDEATALLFSDAVLYRSPFTQRPAELASAMSRVRARGGTALNDALYQAIRLLETRQGRRVVVLLSDGVDIHSVLGAADALWALRRSRSMVYWIDPGRGVEGALSPWRDTAGHAAERQTLADLVEESGGRILPIAGPEEAPGAFRDILAELRRQVVLGYYPTRDLDDGAWHSVRVRVKESGAKARTRDGYVDD